MKFEKQNVFFASDFHVSHKNVIKFDKRPFDNIDEMHTELIKNWNSVVGPDDIVYYLGDFSLGRSETAKWFAHSLNGKIYYIMGNHDGDIDTQRDIKALNRFERIHEYGTEIWIKDDDLKSARGSNGYQQVILCHYAILSWNRAHYGSWHLHGHSHGSLMKSEQDVYKRNVLDVGVNCIDYTPISYQQVKDIMSKREIISVDHHGE